ncbi:SpoIIE family protein phosphatase [Kitasatospora aureofaciens]|uniref:SpoIIE family protein phosphatase n=1 Tax=Kitasatospora aureofaciens TaxID=1894 RepID=UPI0030B80B2C
MRPKIAAAPARRAAGHPAANGSPSPLLDLAELIGGDYSVESVRFTRGDLLLLYTGGVIETRNRTGEFLPLPDWMRRQTRRTQADGRTRAVWR